MRAVRYAYPVAHRYEPMESVMSEIPVNDVTMADMFAWYEANEELKKIKAKELLLRNKIFKGKFHSPREGVNQLELADGYVLKGTHVINRSIDAGALDAYREKFPEFGIQEGLLIVRKPELKIAEYRKLTDEQRNLFDNVLVVKEGTPSLEIVLPKRKS